MITPFACRSDNRLLTGGSRKRLATLGNRVALDARRHVAVGVQRHPDRGMAELLGDHLRVFAGLQRHRRPAVPQIVEPAPELDQVSRC